MTARAILDAAMSEAQLQRTVIEMAQRCGWLTFHLPDAALAELAKRRRWQEMPDQGFPDTILVHPDHPDWPVVVAELKTEHGLVRPAQRTWLDALDRRTVQSVVWRPRDLDSIEEVALRGGGMAQPANCATRMGPTTTLARCSHRSSNVKS